MRNLGAAYDTRMASESSQPLIRVTISDWAVGEDPFDLTPYVSGLSVTRSLRDDIGHATMDVPDDDGRFGLGGSHAAVLQPNNGTVTIELGEMLSDGRHYWTVWTGGIISREPHSDATGRRLSIEIGPRGNDLESISLTSLAYGGEGVSPAIWQANDIVEDVFESFGGLSAADFNLTALDFELAGLQFEGESMWEVGNQCLLPKGYRLRWGYDGRLESGMIVPAVWTPAGTIYAIAVDSCDITEQPPSATRIMVAGGPGARSAQIGEEQCWAKGHYAWDHPGENFQLGGGDCIKYFTPNSYTAVYWMAGPKGQKFRRSEIRNLVVSLCTGGLCLISNGFLVAPYIQIEYWNPTEERMECQIFFTTGDYPNLWIDFSFEVWGHPYSFSRPALDAQVWDDALISSWGERHASVQAPAAMTYALATDVGGRELVFAQKSVKPFSLSIKGLDLRIEEGDIWTLEREEGDLDIWVHQVTHTVADDGGQTALEGYLV